MAIEIILIPLGLGILWMTLVGIQTKLLVKTKSEIFLILWVFITSLIWGYLVRVVVLSPAAIVPYAVGTGIGAYLSRVIGKYLI